MNSSVYRIIRAYLTEKLAGIDLSKVKADPEFIRLRKHVRDEFTRERLYTISVIRYPLR